MATDNKKKPKLLIVDDETINIKLLVELFNNTFTIMVAKDGKAALELVDSDTPPDIILLDVNMPGMSGYEVCKKLKLQPTLAHVPVIFLTSLSKIDDKMQGFDLGAVDYVCKPFDPRELTARVKLHLELKQAKDEIQTLRGILPICSHCKKIRDGKGYWNSLESYIQEHSEALFSHGICTDCSDELYGDQEWYIEMKNKNE